MLASDFLARCIAGLIYAFVWCVGWLPLGLLGSIGSGAGQIAYAANIREAKVARCNLEIIAPELSVADREAQVSAILRATGRNALETLRVWTSSQRANMRLIRREHGVEAFSAALATGRGLIIAAPHYGNWELLNQWLAAHTQITVLFRRPEHPWGEAFLRRVRGRENIRQVPAEGAAMRGLFKALQAGGVVGILPDQQPKFGGGEFAPFFGRQALTLSLIPRLAARSGATVLFAYAERVDGGFELHFEVADPAIASENLVTATAAMNAQVEAIARRDPRQYQWTYKRYSLRPPGSGETNPYLPVHQ